MPLLRALKQNLFAPPYRLLPLVVFAFFALSFTLHPASPLRTHQLFDTDDYMRLNEVINWLQSVHPFGDGWYDLSQPRLSPGDHVVVHWARLVDLPLALFAQPFIQSLDIQNAVMIAAFIVPPLLFAVLLLLLPAVANPLTGKHHANLAAVMILFAPAVLINFLPGRADHHDYGMLIALFGLFCLQRMILCRNSGWLGIAAAITFACGLWIGTETLPWLILFTTCLALIAVWRGGYILRHAAIFGLALPIAVASIMPLALPHDQYTSRALSWFSGADLIFAMLAGAVLIGSYIAGRLTEKRWLRLALLSASGFFAALMFAYVVPDAVTGVYSDYDNFFNTTLIGNIGEAQPFLASIHVSIYTPVTFLHAALMILHTIFLPCLASLTVLWNLFRGSRHSRIVWLMHGFFLLPALILAMFWQVRVVWFAQMFSIAPATWLVWRAWQWIGACKIGDHPRFWAQIVAFVCIAPLPVVLLPSMIAQERFYPDLLLFPAARTANVCPLEHTSEFINLKYGNQPRVILAGINEGPELMFRTPHSVLAAPYNVDGNGDAFQFFNARDERKAVDVIARRHADLVLVCKHVPPFLAGLESFQKRFHAYFFTNAHGHLSMRSSRNHPTLIERLVDGDLPAWLKPVPIPGEDNYLLFEVSY